MTLYEKIIAVYPELTATPQKDVFASGIILLFDDADGKGAYIARWEYAKPIPDGLTLGKPTA